VILVDTSVWIEFFRGNNCPETALLGGLLRDSNICICGPILSELLQGVRNEREFSKIQNFANSLIYFPFHDRYFLDAAQLYRTCRKKGVTIRKTIDCFIAACAIDHEVELLHADSDFTALAKCTPLLIYGQ
jgi:predicted nucleic acid-binding protein